jgi:alkanesulfonate monooxygenase SsuD/methylene tetrahydromethanopterin reductase-like flavin-dependent oxidoreductase (luciferase family)
LRRVADIGQGWYGFGLDPEATAQRVSTLERMLARRGRKREDLEISICPYTREMTPELLDGYHRAGVDRVIAVCAARDVQSLTGALDAMSKNLVEPAGRM